MSTKLGSPPPATAPGKSLALVRRYRTALVPALVGLFLAVTLHPLWRATRGPEQLTATSPHPSTAGSQTAHSTPAVAGKVAPSPGGPWALLATERDAHGRPVERTSGRYPTQETCAAALTRTYEPLLQMIRQTTRAGELVVQQEAAHWQWTISRPEGPPQIHKAWCEARAG